MRRRWLGITTGLIGSLLLACTPYGLMGSEAHEQGSGGGGGAVVQGQRGGELLKQIPFQEWPALGGEVIGLLVTMPSPWGSPIGWIPHLAEQGEARGHGTYYFMTEMKSPWAVYFQSRGEGQNFLKSWSVPLPDGSSAQYDAAMYAPSTQNGWGLEREAHLVRLEVNGGRGAAAGLHFVVTRADVLDGSDGYPIVVSAAMRAARARFDAFAAAAEPELARELERAAQNPAGASLGPEQERRFEGIFPTWLAGEERLRVLFIRRVVKTSQKHERRPGGGCNKYKDMPGFCPPPRDIDMVMIHGYGVELGMVVEFDRGGREVRVVEYAPGAISPSDLVDAGLVTVP